MAELTELFQSKKHGQIKNGKKGIAGLRSDLREVSARADAAFKLAGVSGLLAARTSRELRRLFEDGTIEADELQAAEERFTDLVLEVADNPTLQAADISKMISKAFPKKVQGALMAALTESSEPSPDQDEDEDEDAAG